MLVVREQDLGDDFALVQVGEEYALAVKPGLLDERQRGLLEELLRQFPCCTAALTLTA